MFHLILPVALCLEFPEKILSTTTMQQSRPSSSAAPNLGARRKLGDITNVNGGNNPTSGKPGKAVVTNKPSGSSFFEDSQPTSAPLLSSRPKDDSVAESTSASLQTHREADDIDARDASNPLMVTHYVQEIYSNMRLKEVDGVSSTYMQRQPHINEKMRAILIDWLVSFNLNNFTGHSIRKTFRVLFAARRLRCTRSFAAFQRLCT